MVSQIKASLFFGEFKTAATILKVLGEEYDYTYTYGEEIRFELYDQDDESFVYATYNGEPMSLDGRADDGSILFQEFMDFICDKLYYGDIEAVRKGDESYKSSEN